MLKILQTDDHPLFRAGTRYVLEQLDTQLEYLETEKVEHALQLLADNDDIDLILLDLNMPGSNGISSLQTLWKAHPTVPVVVLSDNEKPHAVEMAMNEGAAGYIPKSATSETLLSALKLVLEGGIYAPRINSRRRHRENRGQTNFIGELTQRQLEVLRLMTKGLPNKLIARELFVSEATVKGHVTAILNTFAVRNRVQAVNRARELELDFGFV